MSFDDLVGAEQERFGDGQPKDLCSRQVNNEIELRRLLHWEVGWVRAVALRGVISSSTGGGAADLSSIEYN